MAFNNRKPHVVVIFHLFPVGEITTGTLSATFYYVTCQASLGQLVVIAPTPSEFMNQGRQYQCAIHHPTGDNNIRSLLQCGHDSGRAQIGVHADNKWRQGVAAVDFVYFQLPDVGLQWHQVITQDYGHLQTQTRLLDQRFKCLRATCWIDASGVANDFGPFGGDVL